MATPAAASPSRLQEGDPAPAFDLPATSGQTSLAGLKGKKVVLYFYPKDDTPGCTVEGIDFSRLKKDFDAADTLVFGVSKDSLKSHEKFCGKHSLTIPLITDNSAVCEAYGVWAEKSMYGKKYMGIERTTLLIDAQGIITRIWPKVKVEGHADEVLAAARGI